MDELVALAAVFPRSQEKVLIEPHLVVPGGDMKCAACGGYDLVHEERCVDYRYGHGSVLIADLEADFCSDCGNFFMGKDESERYVTATRQIRIEVNSTVVDPKFLKSVRQRLNISQLGADRIFCQLDGAFAAFENGIAKVPLELVQLLKLLGNHPELLKEIETPMAYPKEEGRTVSLPHRL